MERGNARFQPQAKLASHPEFARFVAGQRVSPINVEISLTHVCQAKCSWCFYAGTHQKMGPESVMDFEMAVNLLADCAKLGVKAVTWTGGGEPTLHPEFPKLVEVAATMGLKQGLFTNGLSMPRYDASLLEWVRVSNTDRDWNHTVLHTIRQRARVMGMALNYVGEDEAVLTALETADLVNADYVQVRQTLTLHGHVTHRVPPAIKHAKLFITEYKFEDSADPHGYKNCYGFNFCPFVWHDGDVDVCGYHRKRGGAYTLGSLKEKRFAEIFAQTPRHVPVILSCQVCCKNHECNKLTNAAVGALNVEFV